MLNTGAAIVGIGRTALTRDSGRTTAALAGEAVRQAITDAGLSPSDVDGVAAYGMGDSVLGIELAHHVGITDLRWWLDFAYGGMVVSGLIAQVAAALSAGLCQVAVIYRAANGRSGRRSPAADGRDGAEEALRIGGRESQFHGPAGLLLPMQYLALQARRHQHLYGSTSEDLGRIAVTQRLHAAPNEHAIARSPLTLDEYLASPFLAEPLRRFDCCYEVDGAMALVMTTADRARDLRRAPVHIIDAESSYQNGGYWDTYPDPTRMYSAAVGQRLWARTGLGPLDIDVACLYDGFTYTVMVALEDFGFCRKGEVGGFYADGSATYGGQVVVNPHGGLLSEGYLHGMNHHYEAVVQLRGQAGERQVADADVALVSSGAGPGGGAVLYGSNPR